MIDRYDEIEANRDKAVSLMREKYSRQKIAELTGITPSALKKLFYKGHKILLKQLIDHEKSKTFKF